jgi:hypothetical protein
LIQQRANDVVVDAKKDKKTEAKAVKKFSIQYIFSERPKYN